MGNTLAKLGHFFEKHVEKIVMVVAGLLGLWLMIIRVLFSPNMVEFNNETFSPKTIDVQLVQRYVRPLRERLSGPADPATTLASPWNEAIEPNDPIREGITLDLPQGFKGLFEGGPLQQVNLALVLPVPRHSSGERQERREYALPLLNEVSDVSVGQIRAAAYFPLTEVTEENPYERVEHEPNDLDLVTVQGTFNVSLLRDRFYDSFAGEDLPEAWRDKTLADPVFAAVHLQRQEQSGHGDWGPWTDVPRLAIEHREALLHVLHRAEELPPGGIRVKSLELSEEDIRIALLQPAAYDIASAHEDWFPPSLHGEFIDMRQKEIKREKREEREAERETTRTNDRGNRREDRRGQAAGGRGGAAADIGGLYGGADAGGGRTRRGGNVRGGGRTDSVGLDGPRTRGAGRGGREADTLYDSLGITAGRSATRNQPSVDDVYEKLRELMLSPGQDFSEVEQVIFWAHDDRLEPGKAYRYRVRMGVLNPVAGTGNVREADMARADDVILWSPFSEVTDTVRVPYRLRFFAREYKAATDQVKVEVAKFEQGYWHTESFYVKPGEMIGREVEVKEEEPDRATALGVDGGRMTLETAQIYGGAYGPYGGYGGTSMGLNLGPEKIDYTTGAFLVGALRVDGWTPGAHLRAQISHDMVYSSDGLVIERTPIASSNWTDDISASYSQIKGLQDEPREEFRDFGASPVKRGRSGRGGRGGDYTEMMMLGN